MCNQGHIKGQQGVALDDMVYVMTRMARQMEEVSCCCRCCCCCCRDGIDMMMMMMVDGADPC